MKKRILASTFLIVSVCSCATLENSLPEGQDKMGKWAVECPGFGGVDGEDSKSRFSDSGLQVRDFNVWVYDSSGHLVNGASSGCETYFDGETLVDGSRIFPNPFADCDVYVIANVGKIPLQDIPATKKQAYNYRLRLDYDRFASRGLPLASHRQLCPAFSDGVLHVVPLVARYDIRIVNDSDTDYSFRLKSVTACNCASAISPFQEESGAFAASDVLSYADSFIEGVDNFDAREGTLYLLENVQGTVFGDAALRIPSEMQDGMSDCASYLQFEGSCRNKDDTGYDKVTCRYYFGEGREAFVKRNIRTFLTLKLTKGIFGNDEWTVQPEDWFNNGRVVFSPSSVTVTSGQSAVVNVGTFDSSVEANPYVKYSLSYDAAAFGQAQLRMDYKPSGSSVWRTYASQQIQGPCSLRLGTSFLGLGRRTVSVTARGTDGSVLSPTPLAVTAAGYAYPVAISLTTTDFSNMSSDGLLEFDVTYSDGTSRHIAGKNANLSLSKLTGKARVYDSPNGWGYHLSDDYYDCCTFRATYSETVGGTPMTVSADCKFSVWALDAESSATRYNCFQDSGKSMTTSDYKNYFVRSMYISASGTLFKMDEATLCLTDGISSKVIPVNPQSCSWTVNLRGQTVANVFSVVGGNTVQIRRSGNIIGTNASFSVQMSSGYKDTEGHSTDAQAFSVTIRE